MYMLGSTADEYLCNTLETIADNLKISETISAVTLLALGNGAPDIFASLSAAGSSEGIYLSLSSSMGGLVFITAIVTSIVIITAGDNQVTTDKSVFYRNTIFLVASLCLLLYTGLVKQCIDIST
jgi:sodium/potassium/calcium exchanger 6